MKFSDIFHNIDARLENMEKVWKEFYKIYCLLKFPINRDTDDKQLSKLDKSRILFIKDEPSLTHEYLQLKTKNWMGIYRSVFLAKDVTPYIHILVSHLHEFWAIHGDINLFNQEGFEKKNDQTRIKYFSSTNRDSNTFITQLLKKFNRLDKLTNRNLDQLINGQNVYQDEEQVEFQNEELDEEIQYEEQY